MRIGIVTGEYPPMVGGVGAYSHILVNELCRLGHSVSLFSSHAADEQEPHIPVNNTVQRWNLRSLGAIGRWAREQQIDIINLQFQTAAYRMSPWIHFLPDVIRHIPVVTTFHDLRHPYLFPKAGWLRDWIVMRLAHASDGVIVTNHEDLERLRELSSVKLIPIGSNIVQDLTADFDPVSWREKAGAQPGDFLVGYFGLVNRSKGLDVLCESLAQLRMDGMAVRLIIIGGGAGSSDPSNADFIRELNHTIDAYNLRPFTHETGYLDDAAVASYLTACDVVALPFVDGVSYRRGSLMAAIRYQCAIITTIPQITIPAFHNGNNMLMVKPGDAGALAAAIRQLHQNPNLREQLRHGARTLAREFEWPTIAQMTSEFLQSVVKRNTQ